MITKEQIKQRFDERHADDAIFRALDKANGIEDKSRTQDIRFLVRDFYDAHDVEAIYRSMFAIICEELLKYRTIIEEMHGEEITSSLNSEKIKEFLAFNENVEYIKELEKSLYSGG